MPAASAIALALAVVWAWWAHRNYPCALWVAGFGIVVAGAVAIGARSAIERACAGDAKRVHAVLLGSTLAAFIATFAAIVHLNGALDASRGQVWDGVITSASRRTERSRYRTMRVRWRDGTESTRPWLDRSPGERYVEVRFPGALGFEWTSDDDEDVQRARPSR